MHFLQRLNYKLIAISALALSLITHWPSMR